MYIDVADVTELTSFSVTSTTLTLGGNVALNNAIDIFNEVAEGNANFAYLTTITKHIALVANIPVRNVCISCNNRQGKNINCPHVSNIT